MKKRNIFILLILTILILYFTLKDNFNEILFSLLNVNLIFFIISYLLVLAYTFLKSVVTNNLINNLSFIKFKNTFYIQLVTFFFNAITPFSSGGQPFQIYMLNKNNVDLISSTNVVLEETIIHQVSLLVVSIIALILNLIFNLINLNSFFMIFFILGFIVNLIIIVLLIIICINEKRLKQIVNFSINIICKFKKIDKDLYIKKMFDYISRFKNNSKILFSNKIRLFKLIFLNSLALICLYLVPLTLMYSLKINNFDGIISIVISSYTSVINSFIPLPGATLGTEYVFLTLFSTYINSSVVKTLMILWRFVTYYLPLIIGAILFNLKSKDFLNRQN